MSDDIAEAKRRLSLPQLMELHGLSDRAKKSARCPFHEDKDASFSVWRGDNGWQFKCHAGCGNGDEITFLELREGISNKDATKRFLELAGVRGEQTNGASGDAHTKSATAAKPFDWRKCVDAFTDADTAKLAEWRGYSLPFVQWLKDAALVGLHEGCIAFPVHGEGGAVIGAHYRLKADGTWRFEPKGTRVAPLVIGDLSTARVVHVFESQWDAFAVADKLDMHKTPGFAVLVTRGAENGGLVAGLVRPDAELFAWPQNDPEEKRKNGKTPAERWLATAAQKAGCRVRSVRTPAEHKDPNDWTREGATDKELMAFYAAPVITERTVTAPSSWLDAFNAGTVSASEWPTIKLPHHAPLLDKWLAEADLGFVFAARGIGKTHLCLGFARALAEGSSIGPWKACGAVPVLYVDGEMNAEQIRARDAGLATGDSLLLYINHEVLFERTEKTLNLARPEQQEALTALCIARKVRVLFLDNLSVLFSGIDENDNFAWEAVLPWLLRLRKLNIAVIIIAHAGRNGQMRGASKRKDCAAWVLRLDGALDAATVKRGAKFVTTFTKPSRHTPAEQPAYEWEFAPDMETGRCAVTYRKASGLEVFLQWLADGLETCGEIADEMHTTKGTVSKLAKRAENDGHIRIENRKYILKGGNGEHEK